MKSVFRSLLIVASVAASAVFAQYPSQPIRVVVPFPAGGSTESSSPEELQAFLKAQLVVWRKAAEENGIQPK